MTKQTAKDDKPRIPTKVRIPIVKPYTPRPSEISSAISEILDTGMLTNGKFVSRFEGKVAEFLQVEHAVAVSSCTSGLIMTMKTLDLSGEIIVPSFTFSATGHACYWAGLEPVFVDCDLRDWTISIQACRKALSSKTRAVLAVHTFGNPAAVDALSEFASDNDLELVFDSAHAFGSLYQDRRVGFGGHAEVFSLTPTKIITAGEGGIIATNDAHLAAELRIFRNYGDDGSYDCRFVGFNGRMPEFNALLGLATLEHADEEVKARNSLAAIYREHLSGLPGITLQEIYPGNVSSYKDFTILVDEALFGVTRDRLSDFLADRGVATKKYFDPPLHRQSAYRSRVFRKTDLPVTEYMCTRTLTLPMYSSLKASEVQHICNLIKLCHQSEIMETRKRPSDASEH